MKKKNKIKGIIFDLGGVLLSGFNLVFFKYASKQLKISSNKLKKVIQKEEDLFQRGKETSIRFWYRVCKKLNIKCPSDRILASLWTKPYKQNVKIKKDVIILAKHLGKKYPLAILSNTLKEHSIINRKRNLFRYFDFFDVVLLSDEVGLRKPQKEFFRLASKKLNIPFRNLLFIDDDIRWVKAARKLGLQSILFKSATQLEKTLKKLEIF